MSITNYTPSYCEYKRSKLMDVVYLLTEEDYNKVTLANGAAYNLDDTTPIALSCYSVEFTEEETLDERYRFAKTLKFTMKGYNNIDTLGGGLYAIIFTTEGGAYLVNSEFSPKITYTYNLSNTQNETQFTLSSQSNTPSLFAYWYDMPSPENRWVTVPISEDYVCDDCDYVSIMYRWVVNPNGHECSGTTTMTQEIQQVSYDNGETWTNVIPLVTRMGSTIIERRGSDCCFIPPTSVNCEYVGYGIDNIKFSDKDFTSLNEDTNTITLYNGATFKDVEWLENSCSFQETFDGEVVTDTISFDIDMNDYDSSWHFRLLEFNKNRYTAIVSPKYYTNKYLVGFNFGLQPSYSIYASSEAGQNNRITITLTEKSIYGMHLAENVALATNSDKSWQYIDKAVIDDNFEVDTYVCTSNNEGTYLVQEEIDANSNPTGRYKVLNGYEDRFNKWLNIVDTFDDNVTFYTTKCSWKPNPIEFRWVLVSGEYECSGTTKMSQERKQVSFDKGNTWQDVSPLETRAALPVIEYESIECGWVAPTEIYQWVLVSGAWECSGTTKMSQEKKQVSYNNGRTWQDVIPLETRAALPVIETESTDCGYVPPFYGKWAATYSDSHVETAACDSTSAITQNEISDTNLVSVKVGDCVEKIDYQAFMGSPIQSITIPSSVKTIDNFAFYHCHSLTSCTMAEGLTSIGTQVFAYCTSLSDVTIPNSVTNMENYAFSGCTSLTTITIPNVTTINNFTFKNCLNLESATIGSGVRTVGEGVFDGCTRLSSLTISNGVTTINAKAFSGLTSISSITIPDSVTSIGNSAFYKCNSLSNLTIGSGVTSISGSAFCYCSGLTSVNIPDNVTTIGLNAFAYSYSLKSLTIGSGVTLIGGNAFIYCTGLTSVTIDATTPPTLQLYAFSETNNCPIYVPSASVNAYRTATNWSDYASRIQAKP